MTKFLKVMAFSMLVCAAAASVSSNVYADIDKPYAEKDILFPGVPNNPVFPPVFNNPQHRDCVTACARGLDLCQAAGHCIVDNLLPLIPYAPACDKDQVDDMCYEAFWSCDNACRVRFR
jgi:hypothetical protein